MKDYQDQHWVLVDNDPANTAKVICTLVIVTTPKLVADRLKATNFCCQYPISNKFSSPIDYKRRFFVANSLKATIFCRRYTKSDYFMSPIH